MSKYLQKFWIFSLIFGASLCSSYAAYAACSPGIPCLDYDRENPADSNTNASYNGPKTGRIKNTATAADYLSSFLSSPSTFTNSDSKLSADYTSGSCDGNFMNVIYARAFMEANREMIMAQQLIHRPDSVLEYTCFDHFLGGAAAHAAPVFTENQDWKEREIDLWTDDEDDTTTINDTPQNYIDPVNQDSHSVFTDGRMDATITKIVVPVLKTYIENQYPTKYQSASLSIDNSFMRSRLGSLVLNDYACSEMYSVWQLSKCADFGEEDRFRSFQHLVDFDPRSTPVACSPGHVSNDSVDSTQSYGTGDKLDDRTGTSFTIGSYTYDIGNYEPFNSVFDSDGDNDIDSDDIATSNLCPDVGGPVSGVNTNYSNNLIRVANNCDKEVSGGDDIPNAYASFDPIENYSDIIKGAAGLYLPGVGNDTGALVTCADPVPTGTIVSTYKNEISGTGTGLKNVDRTVYFHFDYYCINPGCVFVPLKSPGFDSTNPVVDIINLTGSGQNLFDIDTDDFNISYGGECLPIGSGP